MQLFSGLLDILRSDVDSDWEFLLNLEVLENL